MAGGSAVENIRRKMQGMVTERDEAREETEKMKLLYQEEKDRRDRV